MIRSFGDAAPARLYRGEAVKLCAVIRAPALRKLDVMAAARTLGDLRVPPANRLEALKGNRKGQHSIRINDQWRICFKWTAEGPEKVEIVDYH